MVKYHVKGRVMVEQFNFDYTNPSNHEWVEIMKNKLITANMFEIHCWSDEDNWTNSALQFGTLKEIEWTGGKVVFGKITEEFTNFLLHIPKPLNTDTYYKMTPFFSIFLDNGFSSEHYGTELHQLEPKFFRKF